MAYYSIEFCLILEKSCRTFRVDISQGSCQILLRMILNFGQVPDKIFYWTEKAGSYQDLLSNLFRILKRKAEKIRSRLYQVLASIYSGSCTELYKNKWSRLVKKIRSLIRISVRKHKDLIKIFAGLCSNSVQNMIFRIILRFLTDSAYEGTSPSAPLGFQWNSVYKYYIVP